MQCPECDMRVRRNKDGTIQKHYLAKTRVLSWRQEVCGASEKLRDEYAVRGPARRRSDMRCPKCNQRVGAKQDGRIRKHNGLNGVECAASKANR